jgi:hypothetical protein
LGESQDKFLQHKCLRLSLKERLRKWDQGFQSYQSHD